MDPDQIARQLIDCFSRGDHEGAAALFDPDVSFWFNGAQIEGWSGPDGYWLAVNLILTFVTDPSIDGSALTLENPQVISGQLVGQGTLRSTGEPVTVSFHVALEVRGEAICGVLITVQETDLRGLLEQGSPGERVH